MAGSRAPTAFGSTIVARWVTVGVIRAPRSSPVGSRSARPVAMAKTKDGSHGTAQAGRSLMLPALLDFSQRVKDFRSLELSNWPLAQLLVGKIQQPLLLLQRGWGVALRL